MQDTTSANLLGLDPFSVDLPDPRLLHAVIPEVNQDEESPESVTVEEEHVIPAL